MAGLGDLPAELLLNVVSFITDRTTLRNLPLVSKAFRAVSEASLYHQYPGLGTDGCHSTLRLFLRTMLNRPELAQYVKRVHVSYWEPRKPKTGLPVHDSDYKSPPLSRDDRKLYRDQGRSDQLSRLKQFTAALSSGMEEAEVILLLSKVVNIERLSFTAPPPTHKPSLWNQFLDQAASDLNKFPGSKLPFHALRTVILSNAEVGSGLSSLFRLPSLRHIIAVACFGDSFVDGWDCSERSSSVVDIMMVDSLLSGPALLTLVSSCKALETFDYLATDIVLEEENHFTSREATKAFETQKHSLRSLMLKYVDALNHGDIWTLFDHDETKPLALGGLEKLTVLKVEYDELFDDETALVDLLPSSLETLTLRSCRGVLVERLLTDLFNLAEARDKRFPRLTSVDIEIEDLVYWSRTTLIELDCHLDNNGIDFFWWSEEANCGGLDLLKQLHDGVSDSDDDSSLVDTEEDLEPDVVPGPKSDLEPEPDSVSNPIDES